MLPQANLPPRWPYLLPPEIVYIYTNHPSFFLIYRAEQLFLHCIMEASAERCEISSKSLKVSLVSLLLFTCFGGGGSGGSLGQPLTCIYFRKTEKATEVLAWYRKQEKILCWCCSGVEIGSLSARYMAGYSQRTPTSKSISSFLPLPAF